MDIASPVVFSALALWQLGLPTGKRRAAEENFWRSLRGGVACWFLVLSMRGIWTAFDWSRQPLRPIFDVLFAVAFIFFLIAVEQRPDDRSPLADEGRRPPRWAAALFVAGLFATLVLLPLLLDRELYDSRLPSYTLFVILDGYLALRLYSLVLGSSDRRWQLCYASLALFFTLLLAAESIVLAALVGPVDEPEALTDQLFQLALVVLVMTTAASRTFWSGRVHAADRPPMSQTFAVPPILWSLLFPAFHLLADRAGLLPASLAADRDVLLLLFTAALFVTAYLQQRRFEARIQGLVGERREAEAKWRANEDDLRLLVERNRAAERLRAAEERFERAFEASPEAMILTRFEDGTVLHVNSAFERLTGWPAADVLGKTVGEVELWGQSTKQRERVREALRERGRLHGRLGQLRRRDGREIAVRASFEVLEDIEDRVILTVIRAEEASAEEVAATRLLEWLASSRIALRIEVFDDLLFANAAGRVVLPEAAALDVRDPRGRRLLAAPPAAVERTEASPLPVLTTPAAGERP